MADPEHLEILRRGVEAWNKWSGEHEDVQPYLIDASLSREDLVGANLVGARLSGANLSNADLTAADLGGAKLIGACLIGTNLGGANLIDADLYDADLRGANLSAADLHGADFTSVRLGYTSFVANDLSQVEGLEEATHDGPSGVDINTIYKSRGQIPEAFLRGCGVPEDFITYMRSLTVQPLQFYSCFISYSSKDQEFAERLHTDLQAKGVRVWFASHDLPIGASIRLAIDESIRLHDKFLLVLSEASVGNQWVEQEVETALAREREPEGQTVLFPVRIDNAVMKIKSGWPALLKNTRNVGDFTRWKDHDSYQKAFDRLLRDLKAET
jgi:uncharacterized protein YjbI with pentapeptide repeats